MFPIPLKSLNDQERHDYILKTYILNKAAKPESRRLKRDIDVIKEHHRFLWDDDDADGPDTWEEKLARRYYDKLFKEYCIADLTRHKENKVALRWRTEAEVVSGKGQFICGCRKCEERENLRSWEVNFAYQELGERRNALVKVRLCPVHSAQLNYTSKKREIRRLKRTERESRKKATEKASHKVRKQSETDERSKQDSNKGESNISEEETLAATAGALSSNGVAEDSPERPEEADHNVWSKKLEIETEPTSRETDFERYLEDLLL